MVEKLFPGPFLKNQNWAYLWSFIYFILIVCQVEEYRKWLKLRCRPLAFTSYKAFIKNKKRSRTSLPTSFSAWFLKKNVSVVIFYYLTNFNLWLPLLRKILGNMCIVIVCWPGCDVRNFKINLIFLIKPFFLHDPNVKTKIKYHENEKSF